MPVQPGELVRDLDFTGLLRPMSASTDVRPGLRCVRLVIVESGSIGLGAHAAVVDTALLVMIAQSDGEPAVGFAFRVVRLIVELELSLHNIERAVLLLGPRSEPDAAAARLTIARALITHSVTARGQTTELVLAGPGEDLMALVSDEPGRPAPDSGERRQTFADGVLRELGDGAEVQLVHDLATVALHGRRGDV
jgi:hypothetical protein